MIGLKTKEPANIFLLGDGPGLFYLPHESLSSRIGIVDENFKFD